MFEILAPATHDIMEYVCTIERAAGSFLFNRRDT
jgi:hypothetical protein